MLIGVGSLQLECEKEKLGVQYFIFFSTLLGDGCYYYYYKLYCSIMSSSWGNRGESSSPAADSCACARDRSQISSGGCIGPWRNEIYTIMYWGRTNDPQQAYKRLICVRAQPIVALQLQSLRMFCPWLCVVEAVNRSELSREDEDASNSRPSRK